MRIASQKCNFRTARHCKIWKFTITNDSKISSLNFRNRFRHIKHGHCKNITQFVVYFQSKHSLVTHRISYQFQFELNKCKNFAVSIFTLEIYYKTNKKKTNCVAHIKIKWHFQLIKTYSFLFELNIEACWDKLKIQNTYVKWHQTVGFCCNVAFIWNFCCLNS